MSMPFQQPKTEDAEENFTLRRNQLHLLKGKPTFKNGGFYSVQHHRNEQRKGVPSFGSLPRYKTEQRHFLQGRGITLPRIDLSHSSSDKTKRRDQTESDDSESSSESSISFQTLGNIKNRKIPQKRCGSDMPQLPRIHPMELLEARRKFGIAEDNEFEDSSSSTDESNYYNEIVMSNFKLQETNPNEKAKSEISDEVFLPQREPTYYTLNLDKTFVFDSKRNTLERMTGQEKYPDLSSYESIGLDNQQILSTEIPKREQFSKGKNGMNVIEVDKATRDDSNWKEPALPKSSEGIGTDYPTPTKVALKSALKSRSLQHHRKKRKVTHALKTTSLDRDGNLKHGIENRGFVADGRCMLEGFKHNEDRFARHGHHLDTIDESPITLIL